jgi:NAD(P)-dependent dehydrogenase (short-subunit alcohol dehydrogenase family)
MDELKGRTAFITGGASGIGLATAHKLGAAGMSLVIADVEETALGSAELTRTPRTGDVRQIEDLQAAATRTIERFGGVHVVFNITGSVQTVQTVQTGQNERGPVQRVEVNGDA